MNTKVIFVLCVAAFVCCFADNNCKFDIVSANDQKTYTYDLSKMSHPAGQKDDLYFRLDDGSYIYANICGPSAERCKSGSAVCMRGSDYSTYTSLGMVSTQEANDDPELEPGTGLSLTYSGGDDCILGSWQTVMTLQCDKTRDGEITEVETGECWYRMTILSKYACGSSSGSGGGDNSSSPDAGEVVALVILIILLVAVVVYFGVGVVYQRKVKDAATLREHIIHNEFWCSLPLLVKDGVLFIFHGCKKGDYLSI